MQAIVILVLGVVILTFCALVYAAARSWPKIGVRRRIVGLFLLIPHFLLVVCIPFALRAGNAPPGSSRYNQSLAADVYILFILPVPAVLGSIAALLLFFLPRPDVKMK